MAIEVRVFLNPIFWKRPYYVDYGDGMFGAFQVRAAAHRAAAFYRKKDDITVKFLNPPVPAKAEERQ